MALQTQPGRNCWTTTGQERRVEEVDTVCDGIIITSLLKEFMGLADCVRELDRTRHKPMQTKVSARQRPRCVVRRPHMQTYDMISKDSQRL